MMTREVYFYLPEHNRPNIARLPTEAEWAAATTLFNGPPVCWVWRTWLHLSQSGFPCRLVDKLPDEGIIVVASCMLPLRFRPGPRQFIVDCVADSPPRFYTQFRVFQSLTQATSTRTVSRYPHITHMPLWSQVGLRERDAARGEVCVNVDYFGTRAQLAPELGDGAFARRLESAGLRLRTNFEVYSNYTESDLILAAREFGRPTVNHKPGSKLLNAWRTGVPAILGRENGFRELRRSPLDYVEVDSVEACFEACLRLRDDPALRAAMAENGRKRAVDYTDERLTLRWRTLLGETAPAWYERWLSLGPTGRLGHFVERASVRYGVSLGRRARKLVGS